jgi:hypothetical protein
VTAIAFPERPLLEADPAVFARDFDKNCFTFTHRLSNCPLFKTDQLLTLARRRARDPNDVYYDAGDIRVDQRWDQTPPCDLPIDELLRRIETAGAFILLRHVQEDPDYAGLLDACMDEIVALSGRSQPSHEASRRDHLHQLAQPNQQLPYRPRNAAGCIRSKAAKRSASSNQRIATFCRSGKLKNSGQWTTTRRPTSRNTKAAPPRSNSSPDKACIFRSARPTGCGMGPRSRSREH